MDHEQYMKLALELAADCGYGGDVPVGCVIVDSDGAVIGQGANRREALGLATAHAEIIAIDEACRAKRNWRLDRCSLYVTLEPCPMCAGAIINARISNVFYGAKDEQGGACGGVLNLFMERFAHSPRLVGGVYEDECAKMLRDFFNDLR